MLDLNKLERMVDEALAKETKESMETWLKKEVAHEFESCLNYAQYEEIETPSNTTYQNESYVKAGSFSDIGEAA